MELSSDSFLNQPASMDGLRQKGAKSLAFAENKKQQRPPSTVVNKTKAKKSSSKSSAKTSTYRDWQVREENVKKARLSASKSTAVASASMNTSQRMGASQRMTKGKKKGVSKSRSKSRGRSHSRGDSTDVIKRRVQEQFNFYMQQKVEQDDDEISLLEDSQATPARDEKKQIVKDQKVQRKHQEEMKRKVAQDDLKKKEDALKALELRFKSSTNTFKKELDQAKRRDKAQPRVTRSKNARDDNSNWQNTQDPYATQGIAAAAKHKRGKQATELRQWIDNAMQEENLQSWDTPSMGTDREAENLQIPGVSLGATKPPKVKKKAKSRSKSKSIDKNSAKTTAADAKKNHTMNISAISNKSLDEFASRKSGKTKILKHQLPGNSMLTEGDARKYGARADRYGVFGEPGGTEFDRVVAGQRSKMLEIDGSSKKSSQRTEGEWKPSKNEAKQVKSALDTALQGLGIRADTSAKAEEESEVESSDHFHDDQDDSYDDEDEENEVGRRTPESEDSSDKIPVKLSAPERQHRTMINQTSEDEIALPEHCIPGILNTQAHFDKLEHKRKEQEATAALTIQKHYRGARGRRYFKKESKKDVERVEFEYNRLNRELKSDTQYNLKTYLAEKKRIREKHGMVDSIGEDEIAEVIGESGSMGSGRYRSGNPAVSAQLQNFFRADANKKNSATERDPNSLIAIFAKRNGIIPAEQTKHRKLKKDKVRQSHGKRDKKLNQQPLSTDSIIEEEYQDDFSDSMPKDDSSIMEEDIPKTSSGSGSTKFRAIQHSRRSSTSSAKQVKKRSGRIAKEESESIAEDVIDEELPDEDKSDDSIKSESIANEIDSDDGALGKKRSSESIAEDSIIKEEYDGDNFASYNASQSLQARNRVRFGMGSQQLAPGGADDAIESKKLTPRTKQRENDVLQLKDDQAHKTLERNRMVGDLMNEMREYEKATLSETLVNRLEKIMVSSMAQKDQIIMAQRLHELDAEKRHAEEINKIREEQIKLMSQLMLLGPVSGIAPGAPVSAELSLKYREDLLLSIQKIVEKPIEIKQETVHVNYSISKEQSVDRLGMSASVPRKTYLEEYEESQQISKRGPVVSQSRHKIKSMVEEDISLRLGKGAIDVSLSKPKMLGDSIDDLVGECTSAIEESIRDEVIESRMSNSKMSKLSQSRDNSDLRGSRDRQADQQKSQANNVFVEIERAIDSERSEREERLAKDLKRRKISPAEYDRGIKEIEKWVFKEKKELLQRRRKVEENQTDMLKYVDKFRKDRQSVPMLSVSPRPDSAMLSYQDDSQTSDQIQQAQRQAWLLEKEITGMSPEQKYTQKKREAAVKLLEQKEKAIQKALKEKLNKYSGNQAEDLMAKALELDPTAEAERIFQEYKLKIEEGGESGIIDSARISQSNEKHLNTGRTKKSVQFAPSTATKPSSTERNTTTHSRSKLDDMDDISESIQIAESISQSIGVADASKMSRSNINAQHSSSHSFENANKFSPTQQNHSTSPAPQDPEESIIESDYSMNSFEESQQSKDLSQSASTSKNKLRSKAKDIEDSGAYSEDFADESLGKSYNEKDRSASKDKLRQMATVKEESADDSHEGISSSAKDLAASQTSKSSKNATPKVESSMGSLPSDDLTVQDSVRSVDWKFDVPQDTGRQESSDDKDEAASSEKKKNSYIKEEKLSDTDEIEEEDDHSDDDSSSDINTRDEMADLESCPDGVGNSGSMSGDDINIRADMITDELLNLLLEDYKQNEDYNLDMHEQPDEEEYRDKFPWTMDKKPEPKPAPKPAGITMGAKPKPPKTIRELQDEEFKNKHEANMNLLTDREVKVIEFLDFMCKRVDLQELIESLNKPIERDPMKILSQQVNCYDEEDSVEKMNDEMLLQSQILPQNFFNKTDREYVMNLRMKLNKAAVDDSDQLTVSQEEMENINNVHHYALFESFNEALDQFRPYQNKGAPMPWSKNTRAVKKIETEAQAKGILQKAREQVIKWMKTRAGTSFAPMPDPPASAQDEMGEEIIPPPLEEGEEDRRNLNRQEKLAELMTDDILEHDALWVDYEIQDTQTRFDLADMILHHLAGEIAEFLADKALEN